MREDSKIGATTVPPTGPLSGSPAARTSIQRSPRYPDYFLEESKAMEEEAKVHLSAIKKHFTETLGTLFILLFRHFMCVMCLK